MRPLLFQLHSYLAIAVGLYVAILGLTGAIMAFRTEIDHLVHAKLVYVTPAPPRLNATEIIADVAKTYPGEKITAYLMGEAPNLSTSIGVGSRFVAVNPYTGQILGSTNGPLPVLNMIASIHRRLTLPHPGPERGPATTFLTWITVAALFLLLSGIWLWWPRMHFGIGTGGGRPFWYDLHMTLGIVAAAFLVLLTFSGIVMGFPRTSVPMLYALTGSKPLPPPQIPSQRSDPTQPIVPIDRAFAIAGNVSADATPMRISGPTPRGFYIVSVRTPGDPNPTGSSRVLIDQYTGAVLYTEIADTVPAGDRLWDIIVTIHTGEVFGIPSKAIMALASLLVVLQAVSGIVMWLKRVPFREMIPALAAAAAVTAIAVYTVLGPAG